MDVFRCPKCRKYTLSWDSRAGTYVCRLVSCRESFRYDDSGKQPSVEQTAAWLYCHERSFALPLIMLVLFLLTVAFLLYTLVIR